jgi:branched-chain amino acid transport system ATP-binding protein
MQSGERVFIIGPNGAGKTTLFNLLNGQFPVSSGKVFFMGKDITRMPTFKRAQLGQTRSYQVSTLFPKLTVMESVKLAVQGGKKYRYQLLQSWESHDDLLIKAKEVLQSIGLWDRRDDGVKNLSHGEQRRLEIAMTIASGPKLLMLDEPTAGLTTGESVEVSQLIQGLNRDITVLVIAHDMDLVFGVAERILVLHLGQLMCEGSCDMIRSNQMVKEIYMGSRGRT